MACLRPDLLSTLCLSPWYRLSTEYPGFVCISMYTILTGPNSMETDPTGKQAHEPGSKLDSGKVRAGLVISGFSRAIKEVSAVGTFGASKYTPNGWKTVPDGIERYTDAMYRHLLAEAAGEDNDVDSKLLHAAHTAWNALARLELILLEQKEMSWVQEVKEAWASQYLQVSCSNTSKTVS